MVATSPSRSEVKRERVRDAAQRLFVQLGFEGTSMDAIAAGAGVSKPTLYRYYENKEALFADVLRALSVRRVWSDVPPAVLELPITSRAELATIFLALAQSALPHLLDPTYLGLLRVLIAESPRFPQLAQLFRASVIQEGPHVLTTVVERAHAAGLIKAAHPRVALRLFLGPLLMYVLGDGLLMPIDGPLQPPQAEIAALVELFVRAITCKEGQS